MHRRATIVTAVILCVMLLPALERSAVYSNRLDQLRSEPMLFASWKGITSLETDNTYDTYGRKANYTALSMMRCLLIKVPLTEAFNRIMATAGGTAGGR